MVSDPSFLLCFIIPRSSRKRKENPPGEGGFSSAIKEGSLGRLIIIKVERGKTSCPQGIFCLVLSFGQLYYKKTLWEKSELAKATQAGFSYHGRNSEALFSKFQRASLHVLTSFATVISNASAIRCVRCSFSKSSLLPRNTFSPLLIIIISSHRFSSSSML